MTATVERAPASGNLRKHTSRNPVQQWLLARFHRRIAALIAAALPPKATPPVIVEAGCGEGFVLAALGKAVPSARYLGLDVRPEALAAAATQAPRAALARTDVLHLPLRDGAADVTLCLEVLEHLRDPWTAVAELRRVTRGSIIVSVPSQPWFSLANLARGKNLSTWGDDPEHVQHWRAATFLRTLNRHAAVHTVAYSFPWVIAMCEGGGG